MSGELPPDYRPDWQELLEAALTIEGSVGNSYRRLYDYSMGNIAFLMAQGVTPQPVATYDRWKSVDRHVKRGAKARYIFRPIIVKLKDELDDQGQPKTIQKFKAVKSVFPISDTEGEPLPPLAELPNFSQERMLGNLGIKLVEFESFTHNAAGYSFENKIALNPIAEDPEATLFHETAHIVSGHTTKPEEYRAHRGAFEFEAEGASYLTLNELEMLTPERARHGRGYLQGWMQSQKPTDSSIRTVFKTTDKMLEAGRKDSIIVTDTNEYQDISK